MINNIEINYTDFNVSLKREFNSWINIVEEKNWYWKTTIVNSIISLYTNKFKWIPRWLPNGNCLININWEHSILTRWKWKTNINQDELYKYILPWNIFELKSTVEQRKVFMDLLWLDLQEYMKKECSTNWIEYYEDIVKDLKKKLEQDTILNNITIKEIIVIKNKLINLSYNQQLIDDYELKIKELNSIEKDNIKLLNEYHDKVNSNKRNILIYNQTISSLQKDKDTLLKSNIDLNKWICSYCWWKMFINKDLIQENINKINTIQNRIDKWLIEVDKLNSIKFVEPVIEYVVYSDEEYKKELSIKTEIRLLNEALVKHTKTIENINIFELQNKINIINDIKTKFTYELENKINNLWIDKWFKIILFEELTNGSIKETFSVKYNWIDYYELSNGYKLISDITIAKIFISILWLDFILIDEANKISVDNIEYIKSISKDLQVIIFKPTEWNINNFNT